MTFVTRAALGAFLLSCVGSACGVSSGPQPDISDPDDPRAAEPEMVDRDPDGDPLREGLDLITAFSDRISVMDLTRDEETALAEYGQLSAAGKSRKLPEGQKSGDCSDPLGGWDHCGAGCPCASGAGDCDGDSECESGLTCMRDVGAVYGWSADVDVCLPECSGIGLGTPDYCTPNCPCSAGEGDCDSHDDCGPGTTCVQNVGAQFGYPANIDVCVNSCDPQFAGNWDFCKAGCGPCSAGQGDCDSDSECEPGLQCASNVGDHFGYGQSVDVCVAFCEPLLLGTFDYCSQNCLCQDGEGDCGDDSDCAPGHICVPNIGADYGFSSDVDVCVTTLATEIFAGKVLDDGDKLVPGARVSIAGVETTTDVHGSFELSVSSAERYVVNVEKFGHAAYSYVHTGSGTSSLRAILHRAKMVPLEPGQAALIDVDETMKVAIAPGTTFVDENGHVATETVFAQVYRWDLANEAMVGNMEGVTSDGDLVMLKSWGAFSVDFVDLNGQNYEMSSGSQAQLSVQLPPGMNPNSPVYMWSYDESSGRWFEEGVAIQQGQTLVALVDHFSAWNFDERVGDSACIKVRIYDDATMTHVPMDARVEVQTSPPRTEYVSFENQLNALYNLPTNTSVKIFVPADAEEPAGGCVVAPTPIDPATDPPLASWNGCTVVDSGAGIGFIGTPTPPYNQCQGFVRLPTNMRGRVQGTALLQSRTDHNAMTVQAVEQSTGAIVGPVSVGVNGSYLLELDAGTYDLEFQAASFVTMTDTVTVEAGDIVNLQCGQLRAGDVEDVDPADKDVIDPDDLMAIVGQIGFDACADRTPAKQSACEKADLDGDGFVTDDDRLLAQANDGIMGPMLLTDSRSECISRDVDALEAGNLHTCAIMTDRTLKCWGDNRAGQLGLSGVTEEIGDDETLIVLHGTSVDITKLHKPHPVTAVALGGYHTCALFDHDDDTGTSDEVRCWGANDRGQLGVGNTTTVATPYSLDSTGFVALGWADDTQGIATGFSHSCAWSASQIKCWGSNSSGQLGINSNDGYRTSPGAAVDIGTAGIDFELVEQVVAGSDHTCALLRLNLYESSVVCWGSNLKGQLGYGHTDNIGTEDHPFPGTDLALVPATGVPLRSTSDVTARNKVTQLASGDLHTCARFNHGAVKCWGYGEYGQLGYGDPTLVALGDEPSDDLTQKINLGTYSATSVTAGSYHTCIQAEIVGVPDTIIVRCWGFNSNGQLGYGHTNDIGDDEVPDDALGSVFLAGDLDGSRDNVSTGTSHTCALLAGGKVQCWGRARFGQLGYGNIEDIGDDESPQRVVPHLSLQP